MFTPKGRIMSLPRGATAVDFAYAVHTDIGNKCVAAKVNGELVPLRTELRNGDRIEIITTGYAKPNPAWLQYVRTGKARSNIRHFLKTMQYDESAALGERLLEQALKAAGHRLADVDDAELGARGARLGRALAGRKCSPTSASAAACRRWWRGACCARPSATKRRAGCRQARQRGDPRHRGHGGAARQLLPADPRRRHRRLDEEGPGAGGAHRRLQAGRALAPQRARAMARRRVGPQDHAPVPRRAARDGRPTSAACSPKSPPKSPRPAPTSIPSAWRRTARSSRRCCSCSKSPTASTSRASCARCGACRKSRSSFACGE